jgi:hypothetical protein
LSQQSSECGVAPRRGLLPPNRLLAPRPPATLTRAAARASTSLDSRARARAVRAGEVAPPNPISYPSSVIAFSLFGPQMLVALSDGRVIATNLAAFSRQRSGSTGSNADADPGSASRPSPPSAIAIAPPPQSECDSDFQQTAHMLE